MKKWICIILTCFLLISVPVRGYAVSPVVWGIGEEVILPFLLALLGVQATETISSYDDLKTYNLTIKDSLVDSLSGLAGMETIQAWIMKAVSGMIETDSIVWQKLREIAISNYNVNTSDSGINVNYSGGLGNWEFTFYSSSVLTYYSSVNNGYYSTRTFDKAVRVNSNKYLFSTGDPNYRQTGNTYNPRGEVIDSYTGLPASQGGSYTYDNKTVYYGTGTFGNVRSWDPDMVICNNMDNGQVAWLMVYGGYSAPSENIADYSTAFDSVLTSNEKDDIIDGTSVVQLYNPDALQNGLEIMPGGDPNEDPNLKKIPFAVTADWWNFLQQFGQGGSSNQYVNAYNALNGLDGSSVGRISDAYDSLGIANIVGSAANAAEGIVNLTDNNIYPNAQTVADSVNGTIPQILDPEAPDSGIDNESPNGLYKLPDLRDYFPFCIPFDLIHLLSILAADPVTPEFVIKLSDGNHEASTIASLEVLESVSQIVRNFELAGFCLGLILITRGIIRG